MDSFKNKGKNGAKQVYDDPELEAEAQYAKENGYSSLKLPVESVKKITDAFVNGTASLEKVLKNTKSERKARSRGVSGSTKKDGGRFEYGLDCIDLAYNDCIDDESESSDSEAEYDEYADYVFQYSDSEIRSIVQDYLLNGTKEDAMNALEKFRITTDATFRMLKDLIQLSLEAADGGGIELGAQLLEEILEQEWISASLIVSAVQDIIDSLDELTIDSPKIIEAMSVFLAKIIEMKVVSYDVIKLIAAKKNQNTDSGDNENAKRCYNDALTFADNRTLLRGKCVPAGGHQSLEVLSAQFKMILKEFLLSNDKDIVCTRVNELKVPHFNHDFVYQAGIFALEKMQDSVMTHLSELLKQMYDNGLVSESCLQKGYEKLYDSLSDLYYDLPAAYSLARRWVDRSVKSGFLSDALASKCPIRARSRNVSEGPDGKLICMDEEEAVTKSSENNEDPNCNSIKFAI